jgi:hypothetical protein
MAHVLGIIADLWSFIGEGFADWSQERNVKRDRRDETVAMSLSISIMSKRHY